MIAHYLTENGHVPARQLSPADAVRLSDSGALLAVDFKRLPIASRIAVAQWLRLRHKRASQSIARA